MSQFSSTPPTTLDGKALPVGPILIMLAKGMRPREIVEVFPEVTLDAIRGALLQAAELMNDPEASLAPCTLSAQTIIEKARRHADLSEEDAMDRAVALTRAYRRDKVARHAGNQAASIRSEPAEATALAVRVTREVRHARTRRRR